MPAVESEAILSVDYGAESRTLFVRFIDGDLHAYVDVPEAEFEAFLGRRAREGSSASA